MADLPKLTPYVVEGIISTDSFYTHYKAIATHLDGDSTFVITEFNPSFMVTRSEEGALTPTERFVMEYETALDRFSNMAKALETLNEPFIAPIEEILHLNNTVYVVRVVGRYKTLNEFFVDRKMDFSDAYVLIRPLISSLVVAYKRGLLLQFAPGDLVVNSYGQLMLDSMFSWDTSSRHSITELTKLFYRLIVGTEYNPSVAENPRVQNMGLPPRLTATLSDVLTGEPAYGSIDDFGKQLRTVMDVEGRKEVISNIPKPKPRAPVIVNRKTVVGLLAGVAALVVVLIGVPVWMFVFNQDDTHEVALIEDYVGAGYEGAGGQVAAPPAPPAVFVRMHSAYAITDPGDATIMLNGTFYWQGSTLFHRTYQQGDFVLSRRDAQGNTAVVASGVRPAFITSHGDYIYFSDGLAGYNIRRVQASGGNVETLSNHMASFLHVHDGNLFYTNHSNRDFLYRMDLNTFESERLLSVAAYEMIVNGGTLYFINGNDGFRIHSIPLNQLDQPVSNRVNSANSDNLRINGGHIFYRDVETSIIHRMTTAGVAMGTVTRLQAASFDILRNTMVVVEEGTQAVWLYDINTGELNSTGMFAAYASAGNGVAHIVDFNNTNLNRLAN